ncbi:MAG: PLP-dependent aminotransferase family protein [Bacillota bacterium]
MKIVPIQLNGASEPAYRALAASIAGAIKNGSIADGERLPPIRKLAKQLRVSNATVIAAYRYLEDNGMVYTKPGSGTYCLPQNRSADGTGAMPDASRLFIPAGAVNLAGNTPGPDMFPAAEFKEAISRVLDTDGGNAFTYQDSEGFEGLRQELAKFAGECFSIGCDAGDILITTGAQQAIDLVSKVLIRPNDVVLAENPSYMGARSTFALRGAKVIGVPVEKDGIRMDVLKHCAERYNPRFLYTMPVYQTPTGACMSAQKRLELLRLAEKHDFYILEEDLWSDLSLDEDRFLPLKAQDSQDRVIYIRSFSKIFMPGLRAGFVIAPQRIARDIISAKYITDISTSGLIQRALCIYLQSGAWREHVRRAAMLYKQRLELAYGSVSRWSETGITLDRPKGGFGLWVRLPEKIRDEELYEKCRHHNVLLSKGSTYYVFPMLGADSHIRISYAVASPDEMKNGLSVIEKCLKHLIALKTKNSVFTI